jgi:putative acetyltransferase
VTARAFAAAKHSSHTEQFIVNALRDSGHLAVSLVAEIDGELVGHVGVSPVSISGGVSGWYGMAPVSVIPDQQGKGVGGQLVNLALARLRSSGAAGCVVLGDPAYYSRFGFKSQPNLVLPGVPPEYFQALSFVEWIPSGTVSYHWAFEATA